MSKELTPAKRKAIAKYDAANTRQIHLKLNKNTDAEIIAHLEKQKSIQGYIKELIDLDMKHNVMACVIVTERVKACPDCNTCGKRYGCPYLPQPGGTTRINCPLWEQK